MIKQPFGLQVHTDVQDMPNSRAVTAPEKASQHTLDQLVACDEHYTLYQPYNSRRSRFRGAHLQRWRQGGEAPAMHDWLQAGDRRHEFRIQGSAHLQRWRQGGGALPVRDGLQAGDRRLRLVLQEGAPMQPLPPPPAAPRIASIFSTML